MKSAYLTIASLAIALSISNSAQAQGRVAGFLAEWTLIRLGLVADSAAAMRGAALAGRMEELSLTEAIQAGRRARLPSAAPDITLADAMGAARAEIIAEQLRALGLAAHEGAPLESRLSAEAQRVYATATSARVLFNPSTSQILSKAARSAANNPIARRPSLISDANVPEAPNLEPIKGAKGGGANVDAGTAEPKKLMTFSLNGKLKVGTIAKFKHLDIEGGEINVYALGAIGGAAAYCHDSECLRSLLSLELLKSAAGIEIPRQAPPAASLSPRGANDFAE